MLNTLSQLPPANIAFLILSVAVFTIYPVVLAFAYISTGRDHLKRHRRLAHAAAATALSAPRVVTAG